MKKAIKKIVSAVASVVLGFNMITASQVFAKDGSKGDVNLSAGGSNMVVVPDKGNLTCMQAMATDGTFNYVVKINRDDKEAMIWKYYKNNGQGETKMTNTNGGKKKTDTINLGHANDMTLVKCENKKGEENIFLLVLTERGGETYIQRLYVSGGCYEKWGEYKINGKIGSIAAATDNSTISYNDSKKCTLYLRSGVNLYAAIIDLSLEKNAAQNKFKTIDLNSCTYENLKSKLKDKKLGTSKLDTSKYASQGMAYYDNMLYIIYSETNGFNNNIYVYNLKSKDIVNTYPVTANGKDKNDKKLKHFEIESCVVFEKCIYFNTNCESKDKINFDGIYRMNRKAK